MKKLLFIGDSFTAGENNNGISYVRYLNKKYDSIQLGVPGSTIGEYSLYLPKGYSLLSQIEKHKDAIAKVDTIYLEYSINDISSLLANKISYQEILDTLDKAISILRQINPNAKIKYLVLSDDKEVISTYGKNHHEYLTKEFYPNQDIDHIKDMWSKYYIKLNEDIAKRLEIFPMILDTNQLETYMVKNKMHPEEQGYRIIANNIDKYII